MTPPKSNSIADLLNGNDDQLQQLSTEARHLMRLREIVSGQLPASLVPHFVGAVMDDNILIIYMDSATSAMPVRYRQRELLAALIAVELHCNELQVRIMPDPPPSPATPRQPRQLPETVRRLLENTADSIGEDPLAGSLRRLARGHPPRS